MDGWADSDLQHILHQRELGQLVAGDNPFDQAQIRLIVQKPRLQKPCVLHIEKWPDVRVLNLKAAENRRHQGIADGQRGAQT